MTRNAHRSKRLVHAATSPSFQVLLSEQSRAHRASRFLRSFAATFSVLLLISYALGLTWSVNINNKQRPVQSSQLAQAPLPQQQRQAALAVAPARLESASGKAIAPAILNVQLPNAPSVLAVSPGAPTLRLNRMSRI